MNEQKELDFLNKELKNIETGEDILKSRKGLVQQQIQNKERAMMIQNPDVLLKIQQEDTAEEQNWGEEQANIKRKQEQELGL